MNRKEIIRELGKTADATLKDSAIFLDSFLEVVASALERGEQVKLRGFGDFEVNERKTCMTKHPKTGVLMEIPGHNVVKFTQSPKLRERINGE